MRACAWWGPSPLRPPVRSCRVQRRASGQSREPPAAPLVSCAASASGDRSRVASMQQRSRVCADSRDGRAGLRSARHRASELVRGKAPRCLIAVSCTLLQRKECDLQHIVELVPMGQLDWLSRPEKRLTICVSWPSRSPPLVWCNTSNLLGIVFFISTAATKGSSSFRIRD